MYTVDEEFSARWLVESDDDDDDDVFLNKLQRKVLQNLWSRRPINMTQVKKMNLQVIQ
jgi:hypothetical protein